MGGKCWKVANYAPIHESLADMISANAMVVLPYQMAHFGR